MTERGKASATRLLRVFLCHGSGDKTAVREIYQKLKADGIEPWFDEESLIPGQDWEQEISKAIRHSDIVIVFLSRRSLQASGYIHKEVSFGLDVAEQQPEGRIFLIPLKLEECEIPERLRRWHWVNGFEKKGYERLLLALRHRARDLDSGRR